MPPVTSYRTYLRIQKHRNITPGESCRSSSRSFPSLMRRKSFLRPRCPSNSLFASYCFSCRQKPAMNGIRRCNTGCHGPNGKLDQLLVFCSKQQLFKASIIRLRSMRSFIAIPTTSRLKRSMIVAMYDHPSPDHK